MITMFWHDLGYDLVTLKTILTQDGLSHDLD